MTPVPDDARRLRGIDFAVLWGDLSIGLLVLVTGALLIQLGLGFRTALLAIVVGSAIGCGLLALVGWAGAREGVPGMVLFRPILGVRGSYLPTVLNIVQLLGWTAFEFWAMALVASSVGGRLFGVRAYGLWLAVVAVLCTLLALGGPVLVVRRWMERFGAWVVAAVAAWITIRALVTSDLGAVWSAKGTGALPFWLAVDLVIVMPVSWLPLVADYNRFARRGVTSAAGTFWGTFVGNVWFYALGALLVVGAGLSDSSPAGVAQAIGSLAGGAVVLTALLVGETDEAFADIYSAAVSSQNLASRIPQRGAILAVAGAGTAIAAWLGGDPARALGNFESFLFALGSFFVPLYGVFVAHYVIRRRRDHGTDDLSGRDGRSWYRGGFNLRAVSAWAGGFLVYQWAVPTGPSWWRSATETVFHGWLHLPYRPFGWPSGASLPAFATALLLALLLGSGRKRSTRRSGPAEARRP